MWGRAGFAGRCGSQMDASFARGRSVVNAVGPAGAARAVGPGGSPGGLPVCNAARATAELPPTVVAASRPPIGARRLLKGMDSVFSCDKVFDGGLLVGTFKC